MHPGQLLIPFFLKLKTYWLKQEASLFTLNYFRLCQTSRRGVSQPAAGPFGGMSEWQLCCKKLDAENTQVTFSNYLHLFLEDVRVTRMTWNHFRPDFLRFE